MKESIIRRVIILGTLAIAGILSTQLYWLVASWNANEEEFVQKTHLALYRVAQNLAEINGTDLPPRDIVRQRNSNTFVVNTESEIHSLTLEYLLQKELERLALRFDFEYAIFDCTTDQMLYGGYCTYHPDGEAEQPQTTDFAKEADFTYYFTVKFPGRTGFLLRNMQLALVLSVILLITVVFFAYSMLVILRQKRLAVMQKDFINNMTHEFKTPLSTIRIASSVFQKEPFVQNNDRLRRYADIIHEQYERLNHQVEKVLQIAKVEEGQFKLKKERIHLQDMLQSTAESIRMQVEEKGGQLSVELPEAPLYLLADPLHYSNILHGLLDNAAKYGGKQPEIKLTLEKYKAKQVRIIVADQGPGISVEEQAKVFQKFYRIPTGDVHNVKGFGLGLYYIREICRAHGWQIQLSSKVNQGTKVYITAPLYT